ncbi:hypothetical protein FBU30_009186 [Linnemannia zychae]|nr:hypothetical protein FBU30_009186 [Linnemannia zychae]
MTASMTKDSQDSPYMINEDVQFTLLDATQQDTASATTRVMCSESTEQKEEDASQRQQEDNHMLDPIAGKRDEDSIGMGEYGDRMSKDEALCLWMIRITPLGRRYSVAFMAQLMMIL